MGRLERKIAERRKKFDFCGFISRYLLPFGAVSSLILSLLFISTNKSWIDPPAYYSGIVDLDPSPPCIHPSIPDTIQNQVHSEPQLIVKIPTTFPFWLALNSPERDPHALEIARTGKYYDQLLTRVVETYLPQMPGAYVVDVGSKMGWVGAFSAAMGHDAWIFETNPFTLVKLCQTRVVNGFGDSLEIVNMGLASEEGERKLDFGGGEILVGVTSLDVFFEHDQCENGVALLNVDVNGEENMVFEGGWGFIERCSVKVIYMGSKGGSGQDVFDRLESMGYGLYGIARFGEGKDATYRTDVMELRGNSKLITKACGLHCSVLWVLTKEPSSS